MIISTDFTISDNSLFFWKISKFQLTKNMYYWIKSYFRVYWNDDCIFCYFLLDLVHSAFALKSVISQSPSCQKCSFPLNLLALLLHSILGSWLISYTERVDKFCWGGRKNAKGLAIKINEAKSGHNWSGVVKCPRTCDEICPLQNSTWSWFACHGAVQQVCLNKDASKVRD